MKKLVMLAVGFSGLISGCAQGSSSVEIENGTDDQLVKVEVDVGGRKIQVAAIDASESKKIEFTPVSDSALSLRYQRANESSISNCRGDVYVTTGLRQHFVVNIDSNGDCHVKES